MLPTIAKREAARGGREARPAEYARRRPSSRPARQHDLIHRALFVASDVLASTSPGEEGRASATPILHAHGWIQRACRLERSPRETAEEQRCAAPVAQLQQVRVREQDPTNPPTLP